MKEQKPEEPQKIALVTAGASGIGRAIAEKFLAEGMRVHVCDIRSEAIADFLEANPSATASLADVSDGGMVATMFDDVQNLYGRLDILVNNAGIAGPTAAVEDIQPPDWDKTIAVDLNSAFYCTRLAIPLLKQNRDGGSIINMSSNAAFFGFPYRAPYTACKWALIGFTKTLAMELGPFNIRVNAICPGSVAGERIDGVIERDAVARGTTPEDIRRIYSRQSSLRCFVEARDVAAMASYLVSDAGRRVSGQALGLDGHTETLSDSFVD